MTGAVEEILPTNADAAHLVGRVWDPTTRGPRVVSVRGGQVYDLTDSVSTVSELLDRADALDIVGSSNCEPRWLLADLVADSLSEDRARPHLLAPIDLQVIKACGVTFVESMIERVIEEKCAGDASRAEEVRALVLDALGGSLASLRPGSIEAEATKDILVAQGMWSQYLEVGIGPDPEIFTKAPVLSAVGFGARVGIPTFSSWSNPEPELVLVADSTGEVRGATLGNDVNLRDVEGRSALLLGMAKDNNASCAIGPFLRLFDNEFTAETLRTEEIGLTVTGVDGYCLAGHNSVARMSRPFEELLSAARGMHHQYPDGFALFTGTLFSPTQDRGVRGLGFTHEQGDDVVIHSEHLGTLRNVTGVAEELPPWTFGIRALFSYLATRHQVKETA